MGTKEAKTRILKEERKKKGKYCKKTEYEKQENRSLDLKRKLKLKIGAENKADRHKSRAHTKELTHIKTRYWPTHLQIWILAHLHTWTFAYLYICLLTNLHTYTFTYL